MSNNSLKVRLHCFSFCCNFVWSNPLELCSRSLCNINGNHCLSCDCRCTGVCIVAIEHCWVTASGLMVWLSFQPMECVQCAYSKQQPMEYLYDDWSRADTLHSCGITGELYVITQCGGANEPSAAITQHNTITRKDVERKAKNHSNEQCTIYNILVLILFTTLISKTALLLCILFAAEIHRISLLLFVIANVFYRTCVIVLQVKESFFDYNVMELSRYDSID